MECPDCKCELPEGITVHYTWDECIKALQARAEAAERRVAELEAAQVYIYVLTSGEYADCHVAGVVTSDTPINWTDVRAKIIAWLNENYPDETLYLTGVQRAEALEAAGLTFTRYKEITYEPRWQAEGQWRLIEDTRYD